MALYLFFFWIVFSNELFEYFDSSFSYKGNKHNISSVNFFSLSAFWIKLQGISRISLKILKVKNSLNTFVFKF